MGPLDRRVALIRVCGPRLIHAIRKDGIDLEPEDIAAELELCCNTELTHGGVSPYMMLSIRS